ncbi:DNA-processing protein DprA, partial [Psychrobacter sp. CAL346-MNA-CIBAN-0220]|uniref:DNA-processing protein DprA n=1 Tax=Psychrobacter sp. CAL346-MNA-CIBAN-0220 TaxID=3140457 RepID=UPI00332BD72E
MLPSIAMVGSRNASRGGLDITAELAYHLAHQGFSIPSGMAAGIDGAAHNATLAANGTTIAVLGSGVECIYPKR